MKIHSLIMYNITAINFNASPYRISTHPGMGISDDDEEKKNEKQNKQRQKIYITAIIDLIILISFFYIYINKYTPFIIIWVLSLIHQTKQNI